MNDTRDPTAEGTPPAPASEPMRRLVRSRSDRKVAGVAGGLGAYTGLDPVLFRLGFVLATFFGGAGLLAYAIAWIVLPEGDTGPAVRRGGDDDSVSLISLVVGGFLLVLGVATLFDLADVGFLWPASWPVALIAAGVAVIVWARRRDASGPGDERGAGPTGNPPVGPPTARTAGAAPVTDLLPVPFDGPHHPVADVADGADVASAADAAGGDEPAGTAGTGEDAATGETGGTGGTGGTGEYGAGARAEEPGPGDGPPGAAPARRRGGRISATALTVAAIFLFVGVAALGHLADWWDLAPGAVLGGTLVLCGAGLVASVWLGRGLLLIPLGVLCALGLLATAWIDVPIRGGIGGRTELPVVAADVDEPYRLAIGRLTLDLTGLDVDGVVDVQASVGVGGLTVLVPDDVALDLEARAGVGEVLLDGTGIDPRTRSEDGMGASIERQIASQVRPDDTIDLEARVGIGQVSVERVPVTSGRVGR